MNIDTERLDFLEREGYVSLKAKDGKVHIFTVTGQHIDASTLREAIDHSIQYGTGERCWYCEWWDFHTHQHKDKSWWKGGKPATER